MRNQRKLIDELYQAYLAEVYQHAELPRLYDSKEQEALIESGISFTYGEMLFPSVKKLLDKLKFTSNDVFLDLGSGLGKFSLQVFMETNVGKVIGIEALPELCEQARKAILEVRTEFPFFWDNNRTLDIVTGNFLTQSWQGANIIYSCSTCFREELLDAIGNKINQEKQVEHVFTLRPLPTLERLTLKQVFTVECSWDSALCYYYADLR